MARLMVPAGDDLDDRSWWTNLVGPNDPALVVPDQVWDAALSDALDGETFSDDDLVPVDDPADDDLHEDPSVYGPGTDSEHHGSTGWVHHDIAGDVHDHQLNGAFAGADDTLEDSHDSYAVPDDGNFGDG
jgi:hypothetical protein